jgi:hypothetical protein
MATWLGLLVDLAEQKAAVTAVVAGQRRSGRIIGVGRDFCVLQSEQGRTALIGAHEISQLWPDPDLGTAEGLPAGDRSPSVDLPLISALALLAEERSPVGLVSSGGVETTGELAAVGDDVLTLRTAPPARRLVHLPVGSVAVCELR